VPFMSRPPVLPRALFLRILGLALATLCLGGCHSHTHTPAVPVSSFTPFTAADRSCTGDGPTGWATDLGEEGAAVTHVTFDLDDAHIRIICDGESSLMSDALHMGAHRPAVDTLHADKLLDLGTDFQKFQAGTTNSYTSGLGQSLQTPFTAEDGNITGYLVTANGTDKVFYIVCDCPTSDWTTLQPAFDHVTSSLKPSS